MRIRLQLGAMMLAALSMMFGSACGKAGRSKVDIHHGVGVVVLVDSEKDTIHINHEDIKDFMPAMTMPFKVKSKSLLTGLEVGNRIEFTLEGSTLGATVTEIKKI